MRPALLAAVLLALGCSRQPAVTPTQAAAVKPVAKPEAKNTPVAPPQPVRNAADQKLIDQLVKELKERDWKLAVDTSETILRDSRDTEARSLATAALADFNVQCAGSAISNRENDSALRFLNKALSFQPSHTGALILRAGCYEVAATANHDRQAAIQLLEAALRDLDSVRTDDRRTQLTVRDNRSSITSSLQRLRDQP